MAYQPLPAELGAGERVFVELVRAAHLVQADQVPELLHDAACRLGGDDGRLYVTSHDQTLLVPLLRPEQDLEPVSIDGTLAGRAFRDMTVVLADDEDGRRRVWVPLIDGTARLGVLGIAVGPEAADDDALLARLDLLAGLAAEFLISKRLYGDAVERAVRTRPMTLAAEIAWRLLPPLTFATERVVITAALQPAHDLGGDAFDYAVDGDVAHVAVFDAMGHGLQAGLTVTVAVAAYRGARRQGLPLEQTVQAIDAAVREQFPDRFVTAVVGELDLVTGIFRRVRAGHPKPLLLRGHKVAKVLECPATLPFGLGPSEVHVCEEQLQRGDRLLLHTDGVSEARGPDGEFGVERLGDFTARASASGLPAPEVLRRLTRAVLDYQDGELQDDATLVLVEWETGGARHLLPDDVVEQDR